MKSESSVRKCARPGLLRLRYGPKIRLVRFESSRVFQLRLLVVHRRWDDHVITGLPVNGRGNVMLRVELERIEDAQYFVEVTAAAHRIDKHQLDLLVRTNHENG